ACVTQCPKIPNTSQTMPQSKTAASGAKPRCSRTANAVVNLDTIQTRDHTWATQRRLPRCVARPSATSAAYGRVEENASITKTLKDTTWSTTFLKLKPRSTSNVKTNSRPLF